MCPGRAEALAIKYLEEKLKKSEASCNRLKQRFAESVSELEKLRSEKTSLRATTKKQVESAVERKVNARLDALKATAAAFKRKPNSFKSKAELELAVATRRIEQLTQQVGKLQVSRTPSELIEQVLADTVGLLPPTVARARTAFQQESLAGAVRTLVEIYDQAMRVAQQYVKDGRQEAS